MDGARRGPGLAVGRVQNRGENPVHTLFFGAMRTFYERCADEGCAATRTPRTRRGELLISGY
jgi:hypothetical protein